MTAVPLPADGVLDHEAVLRVLAAGAVAEAAGDPVAALRVHETLPSITGSPLTYVLRILVELGDDAPGWLWSRWMTIQAHRGPMGSEGEPDAAVPRAIDAAYAHGVDLHRSPDLPPERFGASLHQFDWIVRQLRVYEYGGLRRLVEEEAAPRLVERSDRIAEWVDAPMRGLQLTDDPPGPTLLFTDLATGEKVELLDLGVARQHECDTSFIGRVVPTAVEPGLMWEWRPLDVDLPTAVEVAQMDGAPEVWVDALGKAHRERRMRGMYSWHDDMTPVSDISCRAFSALLGHHQLPGLTRADGMIELEDAAVTACGNALRDVLACEEEASDIGQVVATALLWPGVFERLRATLARPSLAGAWSAIADEIPEPARGRAEQLAALGRGRRPAG